jgi:hypothetical protein
MIKRSRADAILPAIVETAQEINADDRMAHWVIRLSVFGSYLTEKPERIGALVLAGDLAGVDRWRAIAGCLVGSRKAGRSRAFRPAGVSTT